VNGIITDFYICTLSHGGEAMTNLFDKTLFWLKVNEEPILNVLAYVVAPLVVIVILSWVSFS
jgi:hypothetical protein